MSFEFDANLFGLEEDMEVQWAAEASPSWDAEKGRYALTLGLGASSEGIKFSIDQENDEYVFYYLYMKKYKKGVARSRVKIKKVIQSTEVNFSGNFQKNLLYTKNWLF